METKNNNGAPDGKHENRLPGEIDPAEKKLINKAHREADKDMEADAELTAHSPNDELDEGETARLGDDKDLI